MQIIIERRDQYYVSKKRQSGKETRLHIITIFHLLRWKTVSNYIFLVLLRRLGVIAVIIFCRLMRHCTLEWESFSRLLSAQPIEKPQPTFSPQVCFIITHLKYIFLSSFKVGKKKNYFLTLSRILKVFLFNFQRKNGLNVRLSVCQLSNHGFAFHSDKRNSGCYSTFPLHFFSSA